VGDYRDFSLLCGGLALDKKALDLKIYDMSKKNSYAEYSVICSATSSRHASSIADGILARVKEDIGLAPISLEGMRDGQWVLIDYGAVVVHIFQDAVRAQYKIEDLWRNCPQIQKAEKTPSVKKTQKQEARGSRP
jgi:ribosome silencing factor RsfS/YbeB/iojap